MSWCGLQDSDMVVFHACASSLIVAYFSPNPIISITVDVFHLAEHG